MSAVKIRTLMLEYVKSKVGCELYKATRLSRKSRRCRPSAISLKTDGSILRVNRSERTLCEYLSKRFQSSSSISRVKEGCEHGQLKQGRENQEGHTYSCIPPATSGANNENKRSAETSRHIILVAFSLQVLQTAAWATFA